MEKSGEVIRTPSVWRFEALQGIAEILVCNRDTPIPDPGRMLSIPPKLRGGAQSSAITARAGF